MRIIVLSTPPIPSGDPLLTAQHRVLDVVLELISLNQQLHEIRQGLTLPVTYLEMEDGLVPFTALGFLYARLGYVQSCQIKPAIEALMGAVQKTDNGLLVSKEDPFAIS